MSTETVPLNTPTKLNPEITNMNISEQMRLVLLDAVKYALSRNHQYCKDDGHGYEVDLNDAKLFLDLVETKAHGELFHEEEPLFYNHKDGNPRNNNPDNLELVTMAKKIFLE